MHVKQPSSIFIRQLWLGVTLGRWTPCPLRRLVPGKILGQLSPRKKVIHDFVRKAVQEVEFGGAVVSARESKGFSQIPHGFHKRLAELSGNQLKVWLAHRCMEGKAGESYPSLKRLVEYTGL